MTPLHLFLAKPLDQKLTTDASPFRVVDPVPADEFKAGQLELARDLIVKEQQIEMLVSTLPGLENSEEDQERNIQELEEELRVAEAQRQEALRDKQEAQKRLDQVIRSIKRPAAVPLG